METDSILVLCILLIMAIGACTCLFMIIYETIRDIKREKENHFFQ